MYPTVEVRWFFEGAVPSEVWEWFNARGCRSEDQPPRVDNYLKIVEGDSLGVKVREGRIEVKQRYGQQVNIRFGKKAEGCVEQWCKWSFELVESCGVVMELMDSSSRWIAVKKNRALHTYRVTDDRIIRDVPGCSSIDRGCTWEIVKVKVDGIENEWWSVGFEAFGREGERWDTMLMVAEKFLFLAEAPRLGIQASYGYPSWLQQVGKAHT
jgi:hypothetical protein